MSTARYDGDFAEWPPGSATDPAVGTDLIGRGTGVGRRRKLTERYCVVLQTIRLRRGDGDDHRVTTGTAATESTSPFSR